MIATTPAKNLPHAYGGDYQRYYTDPIRVQNHVREAIANLTPHLASFDAIAVSGLSGTVIGAIVGHALNKPVIYIRKGESCHSLNVVEGPQWQQHRFNYIFLDDFKGSEETERRVSEHMRIEYPLCSRFGCYLYHWQSLRLDETEATSKPPTEDPIYVDTIPTCWEPPVEDFITTSRSHARSEFIETIRLLHRQSVTYIHALAKPFVWLHKRKR